MNTSPTIQDTAPRLLSIKQVLHRNGLGRTSTYALIARGLHPSPIKVGRRSVWLEREVDDWIDQLVAHRGL